MQQIHFIYLASNESLRKDKRYNSIVDFIYLFASPLNNLNILDRNTKTKNA